jgi:carboxymethylenebutenolidase
MGEIVEFRSNGGTCPGYLATSESGEGPGLIVIQEWWGLVPHITDVADRFAAEGFVALAPDLYRGEAASEPDGAGKLMMGLNLEQAAKDLSGAVDLLLERTGRGAVGVTGFCMGGGLALYLATLRPDAVSACVPWYGVIPWPSAQPDWSQLQAAVLGHYAQLDGFFGPDAARGLEQQLRDLGKDAHMEIYEGCDHAFFNDTRPDVYQPEAAALAWERTLAFLRAHLG